MELYGRTTCEPSSTSNDSLALRDRQREGIHNMPLEGYSKSRYLEVNWVHNQ